MKTIRIEPVKHKDEHGLSLRSVLMKRLLKTELINLKAEITFYICLSETNGNSFYSILLS